MTTEAPAAEAVEYLLKVREPGGPTRQFLYEDIETRDAKREEAFKFGFEIVQVGTIERSHA